MSSERAPRGQALVEFAAVLLPIMLVVVAIIQFGLIFGANVTLTNAAREAARAATIVRYDIGASRAVNDLVDAPRRWTPARGHWGS